MAKKTKAKTDIKLRHFEVLRKPVITEKATLLSEQGKIVFEVARDATKKEVRSAVEALFSVPVTKVNVVNLPGKSKRFKGAAGTRSDRKKAIVTLAEGKTIDLTAGVK